MTLIVGVTDRHARDPDTAREHGGPEAACARVCQAHKTTTAQLSRENRNDVRQFSE